MWVCKLDAGFISLPFKGEAGDLKKKKRKEKTYWGMQRLTRLPEKLGVYVQARTLSGPWERTCCSRCDLCLQHLLPKKSSGKAESETKQ